MIICLISIQECDNGVLVDQVPLDQAKATDLERKIAGVLETGMRITQAAIVAELQRTGGMMIEGKNVEQYVSNQIKSIGGFNLREAARKAGYKLE